MPTILPRVEYLTIAKRRNEWGWFIASGWINREVFTIRFDHKPRAEEARAAIRKAYQNTLFK